MDYPLIIDGTERGRVRMEQEGLYTLFEAELEGVHEGMYRLWVHGGGRSAYLGLMQPWSGGMYLRKKLSRAAMCSFPQIVESFSNVEREKDEKTVTPLQKPEKTAGEEGLLWRQQPDGSLVSHDGKSWLLALPAKLRRVNPAICIKVIGGRDYMIFRY